MRSSFGSLCCVVANQQLRNDPGAWGTPTPNYRINGKGIPYRRLPREIRAVVLGEGAFFDADSEEEEGKEEKEEEAREEGEEEEDQGKRR